MACDSVVLNNKYAYFNKKYAICKADKILDFLDGKIIQKFIPLQDCKGCVFYDNVMLLNNFKMGEHQFHKYPDPIEHEEFI